MSACSVLVVDDDPSILTTVAEFLSLEGYPVQTAANGREALEVVERARPSIVLLDMRMPVLDGWGFAEALQDRAISLPILVMTASHSTAQWASEVHAAGYIAKPFDLIDLLDAVEQVCASALEQVPEFLRWRSVPKFLGVPMMGAPLSNSGT